MKKGFIFSVLVTFLALIGVAAAQVPHSSHVVVIMEENHSYASVIGSSSMPYLNSLAQKYGLAKGYYANTHPSIGNYFELTAGQIYTNNDAFNSVINIDNLARHMIQQGLTWKAYSESIPYVGYTGGDKLPYIRHHNPFSYFNDVANSSQKYNLVGTPQLASDIANDSLPEYSFIDPNLNDDAHNGTLSQADNWLKYWVPKIINTPGFKKDGILFIVFDESYNSDTAHGGGHVATVVVGPQVKPGYASTVFHQHQALLRTAMEALGLTPNLAAAANTTDMGEFFTSSAPVPSPSKTVTIMSPLSGSTVGTSFTVKAQASSPVKVTYMAVYLDYHKVWGGAVSSLSVPLTAAAGKHNITINAWDAAGSVFKSAVNFTVNQ